MVIVIYVCVCVGGLCGRVYLLMCLSPSIPCVCVCARPLRHEPRYAEVRQASPERPPLDLEDDEHDPNYARINTFRQPPSPRAARTPSPTRVLVHDPPPGPGHTRQPSAEDLEGLYAKVNKQRPPAQHQPLSDR